MPWVPSSTCTTARSRSASSTSPCRGSPAPGADGREFIPADPGDTAHDEQRPTQLRDVGVLALRPGGHPAPPSSRWMISPFPGSPDAPPAPWPLRGFSRSRRASMACSRSVTACGVAASSRARRIGEKSCSSIVSAGTPLSARAWQRSATASTALGQRGGAGVVAAGVGGAERALLQDALPDQPPSQDRGPLPRRQRAGTHQLGEGAEPVGLREQGGQPVPAAGPAGVTRRWHARRRRRVVPGERPRPGHRRVVAGVGKVAVQRPQAADETLRVGGDRLGHVAARRARPRR